MTSAKAGNRFGQTRSMTGVAGKSLPQLLQCHCALIATVSWLAQRGQGGFGCSCMGKGYHRAVFPGVVSERRVDWIQE